MTAVAVVALTHDLVQKRSSVTVVWESEKDKRLVLPVPFGCAIEHARGEAEKAIRNSGGRNWLNIGQVGLGRMLERQEVICS